MTPAFVTAWLLAAGTTAGAADPLTYTQSVTARGITIKAPAAVDPKALERAKEVVEQMLAGREDVRERLAQRKAALAIIPKDAFLTALPEFAPLSGKKDPNG